MVEGAGIAVASLDIDKFGLIVVLLAGMFCLDMSLLVLLVFQRWGNAETGRRGSWRGGHSASICCPLVVTAATRVYSLSAGKDVYPVGFGFVAVVSLLVVWPLARTAGPAPGAQGGSRYA